MKLPDKDALIEAEETECAKMLVELAFLLPRGTDCMTHSACVQLVSYVKAIRARESKNETTR